MPKGGSQMNEDRRSFLKLFGIGAVVAPVVGGVMVQSSQALIVEPPKVEAIEAPPLIEASRNLFPGDYDATIYLKHRGTGKLTRWDTRVNAIDLWAGLTAEQVVEALHEERA